MLSLNGEKVIGTFACHWVIKKVAEKYFVMYIVQEKLWWVKKYYTGESLGNVYDEFHSIYPHCPKPNPITIIRTFAQLERKGTLLDQKKGCHWSRSQAVILTYNDSIW